jgi:Protein of unknown function (DUF3352)
MNSLRNQRAATIAIALVAVVVVVLALHGCGGGGDKAPPSGAARLVPADALVLLDVSTNRSRPAVKRANSLITRFPSLPALRDTLLTRLAAVGPGVSYGRDVEPWLGDEAALALLNSTGSTAGSEIVLAVKDRTKAEAFLNRTAGPAGQITYRGTRVSSYGTVSTAFVEGFLVVGPESSLRAAIDLSKDPARALSGNDAYRRASKGAPADRVASLYASTAGLTRLLATQGGALGAGGALLNQPGLLATSIALSPHDDGVGLHIHSVRDPKVARATPRTKPFEPKLGDAVPSDAMAYLDVEGLDRAVGRLLSAGLAGGGTGQQISLLLQRARRDLATKAGVNLDRDVLPLFRGEVAVWLKPAVPAPILTIVSATSDENATRTAFAKLQAPVAKLLTPRVNSAGQEPVFEEHDQGSTKVFALRLGPGIELDYAVFDGKLVISTSAQGIAAVKQRKGSITGTDAYKTALGHHPGKVTSLVFLDFSQLLRLGERTGLNASPAYQRLRSDLKRIKAVGAATTGGDNDSTTELFLQIS